MINKALSFRLVVIILLTGLYPIVVFSQRIAPFPYLSGTSVSYVRTWDAIAPTTNAASILVTASTDSFLMTTQYVDGLGRPIQTVAKGMTPLGKDQVSATTYDEFGREQYKYLPFAANSFGGNASLSDGLFKLNPFQQDSVFSKAQYSGEAYFYSQTFFEASPLNRVLETFAPGDSWIGTASQTMASNRRSVKAEYLINTASDSVRIWTVTSTVSTAPATSAIYAAGELYKNVTKDEVGNAVVEYKDKEGKIILKKVQLSSLPGTAHVGWLCTYYVYDDLNQLRFVLQPKAITLLQAGATWTISNTVRDELCFHYGYDGRGRMNIKKVPGAGEVHLVYDYRDRLTMTQDANMRSNNQWMLTLYDELNRPKITGLYSNSQSRSHHQSGADVATSDYPFPYNSLPSSGFELLTETGYDDYSSLPSGCPSSSIVSSGLITSSNFFTTYNAAPNYAQEITASSQTKGLPTWSKVKVLGTSSTYLYTLTVYDDKGRAVQVKSSNISGGTDIITTQYDFSGKLLRSLVKHEKAAPAAQTYYVLTKNSYDAAGRLLTVHKRVNTSSTSSTTDKLIVKHSYDELGQLKKKVLANSLDSLEYDYNIRGWMLGANRTYAKSASSTSHYFGFDLGYDKTALGSIGAYAQAAYNGNITGTVWKSAGDAEMRKYDFTYDAVNRLTGAAFNQYTGSSFNKTASIDLSVQGLSYDANGNILTMNQKGWKLGGSVTIDSLLYSYTSAESNRLKSVVDRSNDIDTKLGDFRSSQTYMTALSNTKTTANAATYTDYSYDDNGNLKRDRNKDIGTSSADGIYYNHLNLPDSIIVTGKGSIKYVYDAGGTKLKKITREGSTVTTTLYLFGNYVNDTLQFLPQEEGRIRQQFDEEGHFTGFVYDYMLKDHLGNVRMVLSDEQKMDLYPAATMEEDNHRIENALYTRIEETRSELPSNYPEDNYTDPNRSVARVIAEDRRIGPGITLKVMAGDRFNLRVTSFYEQGSTSPDNNLSDLYGDILTNFSNRASALSGSKTSAASLISNTSLAGAITNFLGHQDTYSTGSKPQAFLNWLFFDERFEYVDGGYEQVQSEAILEEHVQQDIPAGKSGYLYVFVSNGSTVIPVYFDNLQVTHVRGPILEETHYYPFGMVMEGISSKAAGGVENKLKYNGKEEQREEFSDGSGLEWIDYGARMYDPQIGRWFNQDKFGEVYVALTPYQYAANNPIKIIDEAGHLLKDKDGNIIATSTGNTYQKNDMTYKADDGKTYVINASYKEVTVYTDKGTPITALQMVNQYVQEQTTDAQGNVTLTPAKNAPVDVSQNCHGNTFADGKLVIIASEGNISTILTEDGYASEGVTMENAEAFTMTYGEPYHSGKIGEDGKVNSDHYVEKPKSTTMEKEKQHEGYQEGTTTTLYDRKGSDKKVSTKAGTVSKGVRTVSQKQATEIRKKNGLKTTNQAVGNLDGF